MLKSHYSPKKKIVVGNIEVLRKAYPPNKTGILSYSKIYTGVAESYQLSREGNMHEAAKNLFSHLRILDDSNIDVIISELAPNEGLGKAINDRLKRASA
jgi:L-threonylcarbamoyladenylate synthase